MDDFTMAELGVFIGVLGGVVTSLVLTFQKSKCETIECCCIKCKRPVVALTSASGVGNDPLASSMGATISSQSQQLSLLEEAVNGLQGQMTPLDQTMRP
tara:strand:- start:258 stop:554 length:297 start_codon:yes stop_codon:yes gene_type:complete